MSKKEQKYKGKVLLNYEKLDKIKVISRPFNIKIQTTETEITCFQKYDHGQNGRRKTNLIRMDKKSNKTFSRKRTKHKNKWLIKEELCLENKDKEKCLAPLARKKTRRLKTTK